MKRFPPCTQIKRLPFIAIDICGSGAIYKLDICCSRSAVHILQHEFLVG